MKKINYEGSLVDDITLINDESISYKIVNRKSLISLILLFILDTSWIIYSILTNQYVFLASFVCLNNILFNSYNNKIQSDMSTKIQKKYNALSNIDKLANNSEINDDFLLANKKNIEKAQIISKTETDEDIIELIKEESKKDIFTFGDDDIFKNAIEYLNIITNDIYFLDTKNKIRALREIKKTIRKSSSYVELVSEETELFLLEENELPKELPVKKVLELNTPNEDTYI